MWQIAKKSVRGLQFLLLNNNNCPVRQNIREKLSSEASPSKNREQKYANKVLLIHVNFPSHIVQIKIRPFRFLTIWRSRFGTRTHAVLLTHACMKVEFLKRLF